MVEAGALLDLTLRCPPLGGTHLGLHEEDSFYPGLWSPLACGLLEFSHMVSLCHPSRIQDLAEWWWSRPCEVRGCLPTSLHLAT
jgi:hypothetical protein